MSKEFGADGIKVVEITNKGEVRYAIVSEPDRKSIEVDIPEGIYGIARKEGGKIIVTTLIQGKEFSMPGFNQRGQRVGS
jgi:uncharacterized OB-fold protein